MKIETPSQALTLDNQLCFAVYAASHAFNRVYRKLLGALDLTYPQYLALLVLWERDGLAVKAIGEKLFLDSGTLTPLLKRLETTGYVRRVRNPDDEREVRIVLTPQGHALRDKAETIPFEIGCVSGMSLEEMGALKERLVTLREALKAADQEPG